MKKQMFKSNAYVLPVSSNLRFHPDLLYDQELLKSQPILR